jgi:hypothetical protein
MSPPRSILSAGCSVSSSSRFAGHSADDLVAGLASLRPRPGQHDPRPHAAVTARAGAARGVPRGGQLQRLLFQLLNEMDGLGENADVAFLLTTNRADLLKPALAQRPGRVDHAAELPLPDAEARRRLMRLYQHDLVLDLASPAAVIARTEGVTASFLKELLRRAAIYAAEDATGQGPCSAADRSDAAGAPLTVQDAHMNAALDELLDTRNRLTRALLGGRAAQGPPLPPNRPRRSAEAGNLADRRPRPNGIPHSSRFPAAERTKSRRSGADPATWLRRSATYRSG